MTTVMEVQEMQGKKDMPGLIKALADEDAKVRIAAAKALGEIGDQQATEPLRTVVLNDEILEVREAAVRAFVEILVKIDPNAEVPEDVGFIGLVDSLVAIYRRHPEGFLTTGQGANERNIRQIGEMLNAKGGMSMMLRAHSEFARKCGVYGAPRNLEHLWDGIGEWRG